MQKTSQWLREGRKQEIWQKYCGYLDLSLDEFLTIQGRLLLEQLELLQSCEIGKKILGDKKITTLEEFRKNAPITSYTDYEEYLGQKNEDVLAKKPYAWMRTSGRTSTKGPKWVPYTKKMYDKLGEAAVSGMLQSSCDYKGHVALSNGDKLLLTVAPRPLVSGYLGYATKDQINIRFLPSLDDGLEMGYSERLAKGFRLATKYGFEYFYGLSSILARIGEQFEELQPSSSSVSKEMLNPLILWRLFKAVWRTKMSKEPLLPKHIWKLKGVMSGGTDTEVYRDKIEYYWGKPPLEGYACAEGGTMAMQSYNYKGMMFFPDSDFIEFIPLDDAEKMDEDPSFKPRVLLINELNVGEKYELIFTNFFGGVFVRYRVGDIFEMIADGDEEIDSNIPQFIFYSRKIDVIDLANVLRITERNIWKAIEESGVKYVDWVARKEIVDEQPVLHVYIERKGGNTQNTETARSIIREKLLNSLSEYRDYEEIIGY
ncbi:MAG: GH3 auxin-responsive promoter family protein, partial [Candidatus Heimdallarchaeota archaeon]|nr:GH3 auxin-responsive promoter family protein [Candidatus Heimdallarchaeota archaeon]